MRRLATLFALLALLAPASAVAVEYGDGVAEQPKEELVGGIHRDIDKVDRSLEVTRQLMDRSRTRPYLPDLMFRLAELYVEKSRLVFFLALEQAGQGTRSAVSPESRLLKEKAISLYEQLLTTFPQFADADKVLFFEAHEYRELGEYEDMERTYQRLLDTYPKSPFRHQARLVLGDLRFDRGDLPEAEEHYGRILTEPETFAHQTARYKLAWIRINEERMNDALELLRAIVSTELDASGADDVQRRKLVSVKREALADMVFVYTEVEKDPKGALEYFAPLCSSKTEYLSVLGKLANRLFVQEKWMPAARVYRKLVALSGDADRNVDYVTKVFEAAQSAENLTGADEDVQALAMAMERYLTDWRFSKRQRDEVAHDFEMMGRDVATRLQRQAAATSNKSNLSVASDAYAAYLSAFADSPHANDMMSNRAEALFGAERFLESAQAWEALSERLAPGDERKEALYSGIVAYFEALKDVEQMDRYDTMLTREGLKGAGRRFVEEYGGDERVANVRFNIAKLNYDQGHFREAVDLFAAFSEAYPTHIEAPTAGHLALDALDKLEDYEALVELGRRLIENTQLDLGFRNEVQEIVKNASFKLVREVMVVAGTRVGATDEAIDQELLDYAHKHGGTKLGEAALLNAFALQQEKGNLTLMDKAAERFLAEYPESPKVREVKLAQAKTYLNVGRFDRAAELFEEVARRSAPGDVSAIGIELRAAQLYTALGEHRRAVEVWLRLAPKLAADEREEAVHGIVSGLSTLEDWRELEKVVAELGKVGKKLLKGPEVALRLGLAAMNQARPEDAAAQFKLAVKADDPEVAAEAQFRLLELDLERFEGIRFEPGKDPGVVVAQRLDLIDKMEANLFTIFGHGSATWSIAALLRVGQANEKLADFLAQVPAPAGLDAGQVAQFKQAMAEQVEQIRGKAQETYLACTAKAYELNAFNRYLKGCLSQGRLPPPDRRPGRVHLGPAERSELKTFEDRLAGSPKDPETLLSLAGVYLRAGDLRMARILAGRILEHNSGDGRAMNLSGLATLLLGEPGVAIYDLQQATMSGGGNDPVVNLATLYWLYGDAERAREEIRRIKDLRAIDYASAGVHPQALEMARALGVR